MIPLLAQIQNTTNNFTVHPANNRIVDCNLQNYTEDQIVNFIVSLQGMNIIIVDANPMASGKTQIAAAVVRALNYESFLAVAHRVSLTFGLSITLQLNNYQDVTPYEYLKNLACCSNSMPTYAVAERFENAVIDEFRQTLEGALMSSTVRNRREVLNQLEGILNYSQLTMCLDADFNDFCIDYLLENTDKTIYRIHRHFELHHKQLIERKNHGIIRRECVENYYNNIPSLVGATSDKEVKRCIQHWTERGVDKSKILDLTGSNKKDPRVKAFYKNMIEQMKLYKIIIYSPCITSGVSIIEAYFQRHYMLYSQVLQSNENLQMLARDRTAQVIHCSFTKVKGGALPTDKEQLVDGFIKQRKNIVSVAADGTVKHQEFQLDKMELLQLKLKVQFNTNLNNFRENLFDHARNSGYTVIPYDPANAEQDDALQKGLNKRTFDHHVNTIFVSDIIDEAEAQRIENASETTYEEINALHRYKTTQMAGTSDIFEPDIGNYLKGDFKVVLRHESLVTNPHILIQKDRIKREKNGAFISESGLACIANKVVTLCDGRIIDNELAHEAYKILVENASELVANGFPDYSKKEAIRPLRIIKNFLKKFGYDTGFLQQRGTVKRERVFTLKKIEHIERYVAQRHAKQYQALAETHANTDNSLKEISSVSVHSPNNIGLVDKLKKLMSGFSPPDNNFEFAT